MNSLIFKVVARLLVPVMVLYSLFLTLRGHHHSGGGFVGGLVCGCALVIYALAFDAKAALRALPMRPEKLVAGGLLLSLVSALGAVFRGDPLMTSVWFDRVGLPNYGTPGIFDFGVYFVVIGVALKILLPLIEESES
ncbi:MAG TPA: MnhB domain-containing protein [Bdellovibrionota bacterium]|jgi:multicomponent Na+:H+ antiporter subunit B|nr:MnhB domain-containing protein [Bdellovibrionota bacterium]